METERRGRGRPPKSVLSRLLPRLLGAPDISAHWFYNSHLTTVPARFATFREHALNRRPRIRTQFHKPEVRIPTVTFRGIPTTIARALFHEMLGHSIEPPLEPAAGKPTWGRTGLRSNCGAIHCLPNPLNPEGPPIPVHCCNPHHQTFTDLRGDAPLLTPDYLGRLTLTQVRALKIDVGTLTAAQREALTTDDVTSLEIPVGNWCHTHRHSSLDDLYAAFPDFRRATLHAVLDTLTTRLDIPAVWRERTARVVEYPEGYTPTSQVPKPAGDPS